MKKFFENPAILFGLYRSYLVRYKMVDSVEESNAIITIPAWKIFPLNQIQDEIAKAKDHPAGVVIISITRV